MSEARNPTGKKTLRNLILYASAVLGLAVLAGWLEPLTVPPGAEPGTAGLGQLLWITTPFLVMVLLRTLGGDGWADFGWRPKFSGNGFWWLVSVLVFPVILALLVLLGVLAEGAALDASQFSKFAGAVLTALLAAMLKNIFEEFAWRGYLAPKVYSLGMDIWLSHAVVGLIWGAWHLPFVFALWPYLTLDRLWYFVPLLLVGTISQSVVYGEIRLATDSVWPAWAMHTVGNAIGNSLLLSGFLVLRPGREVWFSPGAEGLVGIGLMLAVGLWLHRRRMTAFQQRERADVVAA